MQTDQLFITDYSLIIMNFIHLGFLNSLINDDFVDIWYVSKKLAIAHSSCRIWQILASFRIFCFYFARLNSTKYEKIRKCWPYCTRNCSISKAYFRISIIR